MLGNFLVGTSANAEIFHATFIVADNICQCVLIGFIQTDEFIPIIKGKTNRWFCRSGRCIRCGESAKRNVMMNKVLAFDFEIEAFRADLITPDELIEFLRLYERLG